MRSERAILLSTFVFSSLEWRASGNRSFYKRKAFRSALESIEALVIAKMRLSATCQTSLEVMSNTAKRSLWENTNPLKAINVLK